MRQNRTSARQCLAQLTRTSCSLSKRGFKCRFRAHQELERPRRLVLWAQVQGPLGRDGVCGTRVSGVNSAATAYT
eukprot:7047204-Prymnesium_polylepis.1